jgi:hypothetical protein
MRKIDHFEGALRDEDEITPALLFRGLDNTRKLIPAQAQEITTEMSLCTDVRLRRPSLLSPKFPLESVSMPPESPSGGGLGREGRRRKETGLGEDSNGNEMQRKRKKWE